MDIRHPLNPRKLVGSMLRKELKVVMVEESFESDDVVEIEVVLRGKVSKEQWDWMCR